MKLSKKHFMKGFPLMFALLFFSYLSAGNEGCGGANPPFAPFGSEAEIISSIDGINIPPNSLEPVSYAAIITRQDEFTGEEIPLNGVRVTWDLSFAGTNSILIDTNGDGVPDARALQLVDPDACGTLNCLLVPISEWFGLGAFVDSPYETVTDRNGITEIIILFSGNIVADPATLRVSSGSAVDSIEITVNTD